MPSAEPLATISRMRYGRDMTNENFLQVVDATPLVSVDLIVRDENGRVLLGYRLNRPARNAWFVPGGRIRKNERIAEAIERISERELGVSLKPATLVGAFDHLYDDNFLDVPGISTHYVVLAFAVQVRSDLPVKHDEQHASLRWWKPDEILESPEVHENTKAYLREPPARR